MLYNIDVYKMKKSDTGDWDRFVNESENGTIFHLQKFLGYHPKSRFTDCHLMFRYNKQLIGVLPGTEKQIDNKKIFVSHPGASFGGIVFKKNLSMFRQDSVIFVVSPNMPFNLLYSIKNWNSCNDPFKEMIELFYCYIFFCLSLFDMTACYPVYS